MRILRPLLLLWLLTLLSSACGYFRHDYASINGHYVFEVSGSLGDFSNTRLRCGDRTLWTHTDEWAGKSVVADDGSCSVTVVRGGWTAYDEAGLQLARYTPELTRLPSPLRLLVDVPRTCWRDGAKVFVQFSQGDLLQLEGSRFTELTPDEQAHVNVPTWARLQQTPRVYTNQQIEQKLKALQRIWDDDISFRAGVSRSSLLFRPLLPQTERQLQHRAQQKSGAAALALGLAGSQASVPLLTELALSNGAAAPAAQQALILLQGASAAPVLTRCLNRSEVAETTLQFFECVAWEDAALPLLHHLSSETGHSALVRQACVDFGQSVGAWQMWADDFTRRKRQLLAAQRPTDAATQLLWKAQRDTLDPTKLEQTPQLTAVIATTPQRSGEYRLKDGRLIRSRGTAAWERTLEWSVEDGRPVTRLPGEIPADSQLIFNSSRQLLLCQSDSCASAWIGQTRVWSNDSFDRRRNRVLRASGHGHLPECFEQIDFWGRFSPDENYLTGCLDRQPVALQLGNDGSVLNRSSSVGRAWIKTLGARSLGDDGDEATWMLGNQPVRPVNVPRNLTWNYTPEDRLCFGAGLCAGYSFSEDGSMLALPQPVCILKTDGSKITRPELHARRLRISSDQQRLLVVTEQAALLLDAHDLQTLQRLPLSHARVVAADDTARQIAVADHDTIRIYKFESTASPTTDQRLQTELWTGHRLIAGAARPLTANEFWERNARAQALLEPPLGAPRHRSSRAVAAFTLLAFLGLSTLRQRSRRPTVSAEGR